MHTRVFGSCDKRLPLAVQVCFPMHAIAPIARLKGGAASSATAHAKACEKDPGPSAPAPPRVGVLLLLTLLYSASAARRSERERQRSAAIRVALLAAEGRARLRRRLLLQRAFFAWQRATLLFARERAPQLVATKEEPLKSIGMSHPGGRSLHVCTAWGGSPMLRSKSDTGAVRGHRAHSSSVDASKLSRTPACTRCRKLLRPHVVGDDAAIASPSGHVGARHGSGACGFPDQSTDCSRSKGSSTGSPATGKEGLAADDAGSAASAQSPTRATHDPTTVFAHSPAARRTAALPLTTRPPPSRLRVQSFGPLPRLLVPLRETIALHGCAAPEAPLCLSLLAGTRAAGTGSASASGSAPAPAAAVDPSATGSVALAAVAPSPAAPDKSAAACGMRTAGAACDVQAAGSPPVLSAAVTMAPFSPLA